MQGKLIMQELARKLNADEGGNCLFDEGCGYGIGVKKCVAPLPALKLKLDQLKNEPDPTSGSTLPAIYMDADLKADWPCLTLIEITFSEPEKANQ